MIPKDKKLRDTKIKEAWIQEYENKRSMDSGMV
jgi:hypothetical protein